MKEVKLKKSFDKGDTLVVKGMAILLMLFYHLFQTKTLLEQLEVIHAPVSQDTFLMLSGFGNICVAVFAFLSAYGITKGLIAEESCTLSEMMKEAVKRCGRLIGNFAVMYVSVNLLWFSYFDYAGLYGKGWQGGMLAIVDMLGLAQLFGTPTLNMTWWYMELAVMIIFAVPFIYMLVKRIGKYAVILSVLLPLAVEMNGDVKRYLVVVVLGVAAAWEGWLEKLFGWKRNRLIKAAVGIVFIVLSILFRQNYMVQTYFLWIADAPIALLLCWFGGEIISAVPGVREVFAFFGKHSMNMFFVHTFFYMAIYQQFIYSFRYAALIFLVLAVVTLAYSVVLELIKTGGRHLWKKAVIRLRKE